MDNHDVAEFLGNLLVCFTIVIFIHILSGWLPRRPITGPFRAILDYCEQTAEPYLRIFRSFIKPIGPGQFQMDLSPIVGILVLSIVGGIIVGAVDNL